MTRFDCLKKSKDPELAGKLLCDMMEALGEKYQWDDCCKHCPAYELCGTECNGWVSLMNSSPGYWENRRIEEAS